MTKNIIVPPTRDHFKKCNRVLFIDDMEASHACMRDAIRMYNEENTKELVLFEYFTVSDLMKGITGLFVCGFYDWNLNSNSLLERGDKAVIETKTCCFHQCILTRMYDDHSITGFATKNSCWYISKKDDELSYFKIKNYLDMVFRNLNR